MLELEMRQRLAFRLNEKEIKEKGYIEREVKEMTTQTQVRKGSYFYTSWGYDQTNIDYLVVVSVSPSGKTAKCRMCSAINVGSQGVEDILMPGTACGEFFTMQIRDGRLRGSYPYCLGSKRLDSFYPTNLGETRRQTILGFGH